MKKYFIFIFFLFLPLQLFAADILLIDNSSGATDFTILQYSSSYYVYCQRVVPDKSVDLGSVSLQLSYLAGSGNVFVDVRSDAGGLPSETVLLTSQGFDISTLGLAPVFVDFLFSSPVHLEANVPYYLVLRGDWVLSQNVKIYLNTGYSNGYSAYGNDQIPTTWNAWSYDMVFKAYGSESSSVSESFRVLMMFAGILCGGFVWYGILSAM